MDITTLVERELEVYAGEGANGRAVLTRSSTGDEFLLVVHGIMGQKRFTLNSLHVALTDGLVLVYEDRNDPPFVESLMQAGVPREKIILLYAGEDAPIKG